VLRRDVLAAALDAAVSNGGAPGVDGERLETITATAQSRQAWLEALRRELQTKTYRPSPVRRVWIAKRSGGGERPLGIPTVKGRVVQSAVSLVLMPIYEADFHDQSYGFRPKRRAHQAMDAIRESVRTGRVEVLDADLSKFFDTIPHRQLMQEVARRVSDGGGVGINQSMAESTHHRGGGEWEKQSNAQSTGDAARRGHIATAGEYLSQPLGSSG
jgi:RNA-directed DNA polymerase